MPHGSPDLHHLPHLDSSLLQFKQEDQGPRMWIWNAGVWYMSQAMAARDKAAAERAAVQKRYRGGTPYRTPKVRWWSDMPHRRPPAPPNVFTPQEWGEQQLAVVTAAGEEAAWKVQVQLHASLPLSSPAGASGSQVSAAQGPAAAFLRMHGSEIQPASAMSAVQGLGNVEPAVGLSAVRGLGRYRQRQWLAQQAQDAAQLSTHSLTTSLSGGTSLTQTQSADHIFDSVSQSASQSVSGASHTLEASGQSESQAGGPSLLLDPAMFDPATGQLLPGPQLRAAKAAVRAGDQRAAQRAQRVTGQAVAEHAAQVLELEQALVCREDVAWQVIGPRVFPPGF